MDTLTYSAMLELFRLELQQRWGSRPLWLKPQMLRNRGLLQRWESFPPEFRKNLPQERGCFFNDEIKMVNCNADVGCRYEFSNCLFEAYTDKVTTCYCNFPFHQIKKITTTTTTTTTSSRCKPSASATRSTGPPRLRITCARLSKCPSVQVSSITLFSLHCLWQRAQGCPNVHCPSVQHYIVFIVLSLLYCLHCIVFDNVRKGEKLACVKNLVKQIGEFKDVNISSFTWSPDTKVLDLVTNTKIENTKYQKQKTQKGVGSAD